MNRDGTFLVDSWGTCDPSGLPDAVDVAILPIPYEKTTSYQRGTALGPAAILEASAQVETLDNELHLDFSEKLSVVLAPPFEPTAQAHDEAVPTLVDYVRPYREKARLLVSLGGEHSITPWIYRANRNWLQAHHPDRPLSLLQIDAHADLRASYEGSPNSHASAVYPILAELNDKVAAIGIRSICAEELKLIEAKSSIGQMLMMPPEHFGLTASAQLADSISAVLNHLTEDVYVTIDVDGFDPSIFPATGTPEPGGLLWHPTLQLLKQVFLTKRVVAFDVVELMPIEGLAHPNFTAAKLVYRLMNYWGYRQASG